MLYVVVEHERSFNKEYSRLLWGLIRFFVLDALIHDDNDNKIIGVRSGAIITVNKGFDNATTAITNTNSAILKLTDRYFLFLISLCLHQKRGYRILSISLFFSLI